MTKAVVQLLRSQHMSKHPLDNEIAHRFLDRYLKMLDPMKLYFMQSDVDSFKMRQDDLDELIRKGDVSFAYQVFNVFLKRVDECVKLVDEMLKRESRLHRRRGHGHRPGRDALRQERRPKPATCGASGSSTTCWC